MKIIWLTYTDTSPRAKPVNANMEKNVGGYDRIGRFVVGVLLVVGGIAGYAGMLRLAIGPVPQALMALILVLIGVILVVTGYTQKCPINSVLKINTSRSR
jgi:hypothetical protein